MGIDVTTQSVRLRQIATKRSYKRACDLARACGMNESTVRSAWNGSRALTPETAARLADFLHVSRGYLLFGEDVRGADTNSVAEPRQLQVSKATSTRRGANPGFDQNTELVYIEGSVRAGFWGKTHALPNDQWIAMHLPVDPRFPGIARHALANLGRSMDRVCQPGGTWVYVLYADLPGQGPGVGNYVIVERERKLKDGTVEFESSAKRFEIGPEGQPWLACDSDDADFAPVSLEPAGDIVSVKIIGRIVDVINRL